MGYSWAKLRKNFIFFSNFARTLSVVAPFGKSKDAFQARSDIQKVENVVAKLRNLFFLYSKF